MRRLAVGAGPCSHGSIGMRITLTLGSSSGCQDADEQTLTSPASFMGSGAQQFSNVVLTARQQFPLQGLLCCLLPSYNVRQSRKCTMNQCASAAHRIMSRLGALLNKSHACCGTCRGLLAKLDHSTSWMNMHTTQQVISTTRGRMLYLLGCQSAAV